MQVQEECIAADAVDRLHGNIRLGRAVGPGVLGRGARSAVWMQVVVLLSLEGS